MSFSRLPELKTRESGNLPEGEESRKLFSSLALSLEEQSFVPDLGGVKILSLNDEKTLKNVVKHGYFCSCFFKPCRDTSMFFRITVTSLSVGSFTHHGQ